MKIGIVRERKSPSESRTPLTPTQVSYLRKEGKMDIVIQTSPHRCYPDKAFQELEVPVVRDLQECDVLMGIKEVPVKYLLANKTYFFFSHTVKKQPHNRPLLMHVLNKNITLVDYELITNTHGDRLVAFGHHAGIVGAHNALWTWAQRTKSFSLPRLRDLPSYTAAKELYNELHLPAIKIILAGTGRVGTGALAALQAMGIQSVDPRAFLIENYTFPVFCQLMPHHYIEAKNGDTFDKGVFYSDPSTFVSSFLPYARSGDVMINGIYWRQGAPPFFTLDQMCADEFHLQVIADISCDLAPQSSIPSTIRTATIDDPVYGFDACSATEKPPFQDHWVDMMCIDNLPNELAKESSQAFGEQLIKQVMQHLVHGDPKEILHRATIASGCKLMPAYSYLQDWLAAG
ncbi:MAG: alanine dehydrogenase [Saprospiraceae bacterium]|nr:alanine dehydrogenase [Saprospiraceae bacterium]